MSTETLRNELDKAHTKRDPWQMTELLYVIGKVLIELLERLSK